MLCCLPPITKTWRSSAWKDVCPVKYLLTVASVIPLTLNTPPIMIPVATFWSLKQSSCLSSPQHGPLYLWICKAWCLFSSNTSSFFGLSLKGFKLKRNALLDGNTLEGWKPGTKRVSVDDVKNICWWSANIFWPKYNALRFWSSIQEFNSNVPLTKFRTWPRALINCYVCLDLVELCSIKTK